MKSISSSKNLIIVLLGVALIVLVASRPYQQNTFDKITVQEFNLVDKKGTVRTSIVAYEDGEVVFRMMDDKGTIRVKLGASEDGSGLVLLDNNTNPGVHVLAKKEKTTFTVTGQDGKKREY
jgi:hypothetical protein